MAASTNVKKQDPIIDPVNSRNATETFKKALEILGMHYASRTGMEVVSLRIGSPFGPLYYSLAAPSSRICHAAANGVLVDFTGARRGAPHEDDEVGAFYVKDCATAIQLLQMANKLSHRVYNIGNDAPLNYWEFTEVVKKIVPGMQIELQPGHGPQHRPSAYMDNIRIREEVGYRPEYTIERTITEYID